MSKSQIVVTEGISGHWHYHLSKKECPTRSLCNVQVMQTSLPLNAWGTVTHLKETYCKECFEINEEIKKESS